MEFLVEFELAVPSEVTESEIEERQGSEAVAAKELADEGRLVRLWRVTIGNSQTSVLGLYRASSRAELEGLLATLPLYEWMRISITALLRHPNDPGESMRG